jgi:protein TonB
MAVKRSPASVATSTIIHALIFLLIGFLVAKKILKLSAPPAKVQTVDLGNPPIAPMAAKQMGGGGGNHDITPATKGKLPPPQKIPVPLMHPIIEQPKLPEPPSLELQKNLKLPSMNMPNIGDPNGLKVAGPGSYGNGGGGGIGGGSGNGLGPGSGGGTGGGVYQVGGGVSAPVPISTPEAEFSDEARKAKYQGAVEVTFIVDVNGRVQNPHVVRDPGMGLGEKALEAVRQWTFHPAKLQGKPVPVRVQGEVTFTIY